MLRHEFQTVQGELSFSPQLFLRVVCILLPLPAGGGEAVQRHGAAAARRVARPCAGREVEVPGAAHTDGDDGEEVAETSDDKHNVRDFSNLRPRQHSLHL